MATQEQIDAANRAIERRHGLSPAGTPTPAGGSSGESGSSSGPEPFGPMVMTQEPIIPDWLRPIIEQRAFRTRLGNDALQRFGNFIQGDLVAPLNADQLRAMQMARDVAGGKDMQTALNTIRETASGQNLDRTGIDFLQNLITGNAPIPPEVSSEAFNNAFRANVRRAQPGILSEFASRGRIGSGLAQTAQTQAASDSFAGLFNQSRQRQMSGANTLANLFNTERGRQINAAQVLPDMALRPSQIIGGVGDTLQSQAQRELTIPLQAEQAFASMASGSAVPVNIGSLTGTRTTQPLQPTPLIQNLTAAGIDPRGEQGQQIILNALQGGGSGGGGSRGGGFGSAISGGLGGAGVGFSIGGPIGAGIGGGLGFLGGLL